MTTLDAVRKRAETDAKTNGYYLTPDPDLLSAFFEGLKTNEDRYGYPLCPCRLASEKFEFDRDIICPCDYRDADVAEFGACYCRLYVNKAVFESKNLPEVPERRPAEKMARAYQTPMPTQTASKEEKSAAPKQEVAQVEGVVKKKLWYCKQCGYVAFREDAPYVCPICKAKREMFAEVEVGVELNG